MLLLNIRTPLLHNQTLLPIRLRSKPNEKTNGGKPLPPVLPPEPSPPEVSGSIGGLRADLDWLLKRNPMYQKSIWQKLPAEQQKRMGNLDRTGGCLDFPHGLTRGIM